MREGCSDHQCPYQKSQGSPQAFFVVICGDLHSYRIDTREEKSGKKSKDTNAEICVTLPNHTDVEQGPQQCTDKKHPGRRIAISNRKQGKKERPRDKAELHHGGQIPQGT